MFQPETEDLLPRAAPKPSTPLASNEAIVRPTVPEVSILLGPPAKTTNGVTTQSATTQPAQTYAAWKKQVLPKVSFPPAGEEVFSINGQNVAANPITTAAPLSNVYPLRTMTASIPPMVSSATATTASSNNTNTTLYRCNHENAVLYAAPTTSGQWHARQRRSLDIATLASAAAQKQQEVLTICAGTQTDNCPSTSQASGIDEAVRNLASKQDFEQLLTLVQSMRAEQMRWMQLCEMLLIQQREQLDCRTYVRDVGTQCSGASPVAKNVQTACALPQRRVVKMPEEHVEEDENRDPFPQQPFAANNPFQPLFQYQSPQSTPTAQSTAYHAQTPTRTRPLVASQVPAELSRPVTEKSIAMNELALKYLPSEKLTELLDELNIAATSPTTAQSEPVATQPLRNIENVEKGPSDISNASYKYLKKYRLLPEEHDGVRDYAEQHLPVTDRRSPLTSRKTQSPYQRAPSPLVAGATAARPQQQQLLDLDHIRRQPKFL